MSVSYTRRITDPKEERKEKEKKVGGRGAEGGGGGVETKRIHLLVTKQQATMHRFCEMVITCTDILFLACFYLLS